MKKMMFCLSAVAFACAASAQTKWDLPTGYSANSFQTQNVQQFANEVDQATGGKLKITLHPGGSLYKANEIKRAVQTGQVQSAEFILSGAANENPQIVQTFGINVPKLMTLTYGFGVGLAGLCGVLAAPIYQVSPSMGSSLMIVVFAVVVIGGMGSIIGAVATGYMLGIVEGLTKVFYPEAASVVIFLFMTVALYLRPQGIFSGREAN